MIEFKMPLLGADMSAGILKKWLKKPGDTLQKGDFIAEVLTDKGIIEIEVFTPGKLETLLIPENQEVPVGTVLALIREPGESVPTTRETGEAIGRTAGEAPAPETKRIVISPSARKLATETDVDITKIVGTGAGGAITRSDVESAAKGLKRDEGAAMRQAIAAAMSRSKREIPHYYLSTTIDMGAAMKWLAAENEKHELPDRLLYGVLLIKAVALALRKVPELNAIWKGDHAEVRSEIHIGVAISLRTGGLIAPAIRDADRQTLTDLMRNFTDLVQRARSGGLRSSELSDSTITITSLGELGVETVFPIIYPPQTAMVGFGKIADRPWVVNRMVGARPLITATLAADHRVTDGHRGSRFLVTVDQLLQHPENL